MLFRDRNSNDLLNATAFLVVQRHKDKCGEYPTGFHFNKYMSALHRETGGETSPLRLPHCWYRWGDQVAIQQMPTSLRWDHSEPPAASVRWEGRPPEIPADDPLMQKLEARIEELTGEYAAPADDFAKSTKLRSLIDFVYAYAPFPFQNEYRQLREAFVDMRGSMIPVDEIDQAILMPTLDRAFRVFPEAEFPRFRHQVAPARSVIELLVEQGKPGVTLANEASEAFWFAFCYHLRLHPKAHQNLSPQLLRQWESTLADRMDAYEAAVRSILAEAAETIPSFKSDSRARELVDNANKQIEEDLAFIESYGEELEALGKFTDALRKHRQ